VFEKQAIMRIPTQKNLSLESDLLEQLSRENELGVYEHDGFWQCMDTYREMQVLNALWKSGKAEWKTWGERAPAAAKCQ
jgi:glucose-1-phosphate cytidylyltransferase